MLPKYKVITKKYVYVERETVIVKTRRYAALQRLRICLSGKNRLLRRLHYRSRTQLVRDLIALTPDMYQSYKNKYGVPD